MLIDFYFSIGVQSLVIFSFLYSAGDYLRNIADGIIFKFISLCLRRYFIDIALNNGGISDNPTVSNYILDETEEMQKIIVSLKRVAQLINEKLLTFVVRSKSINRTIRKKDEHVYSTRTFFYFVAFFKFTTLFTKYPRFLLLDLIPGVGCEKWPLFDLDLNFY